MKRREAGTWPSRLVRFFRDILHTPQPASLITERFRETFHLLLQLRRRPGDRNGNLVLAVGFEYEKRKVLRRLFPRLRLNFIPHWLSTSRQLRIIERHGECGHWAWSRRDGHLLGADHWTRSAIVRFEDGFVRSHGLGVKRARSMSFVKDETGLHFDSTRTSDLEILLATTDFSTRSKELLEAERLIAFMHANALSKYGRGPASEYCLPPGSVLVLGQVEDDASILVNTGGFQTNVQLLNTALRENDPSHVFYRPHPDVSAGLRNARSKPEELIDMRQMIPASVSISHVLKSKPLVYTISSLGGFEALAAGCRVKTYGGPFYAGWGLTDDFLKFERRKRNLTVQEMFLVSYQYYAFYFNANTGSRLSLKDVLQFLVEQPSARQP
jgi:capsular polysaccharide export protein